MEIEPRQFGQTLNPDAQIPDSVSDLRYELKLVCAPHMPPQARSWIRLHPAGFAVAYPPRRVNSLYIDTPHLSSLSDNLEGVSDRQKLRVRWYGDQVTDVQPYLELKQKSNLVGRKKRFLLPCRLDLTVPWTEMLGTIRANAGPDWRTLLQTVNQPTLITCYRREHYISRGGAVRVTLDYDQAAYDQRLSPRLNLRARLPITDAVVIEIKTALEHAERLPEVAARFPVLRNRHSKYVRGLLAALG
jgi:hypothetical protein